MSDTHIKLRELMATRLGNVDPSKYLDECFELYSIPSFDVKKTEILFGKEIGSAKQNVQENDVLLSKIVPHIRRSWVVKENNGYRQIASGEWIVFRSNKVFPNYLKHVVTSDDFHAKFMKTVSGVGGSLLRARPAQVAEISIPLPPLAQQQRIAAILDKAAEIKAKREKAIAKLDELVQSTFMEMFGNTQNKVMLKVVCDLITDGTHYTPTYADSGYVFLSAKNVTSGYIDWKNVKYVGEDLHRDLQKRVSPKIGDVLLAKNGTTGVAAIVDEDVVFDIYVSLALLRPSKKILTTYLHAALNSIDVKRQFNSALKGVGVPNLHLVDIRNAFIPLPTLEEQKAFDAKLNKLKAVRENVEMHLRNISTTIASLQHQAFTTGFGA